MSRSTCPSGHLSADPEWCDTCGARIGGVPAAAASSPLVPPFSGPVGAPVICPNCNELNPADALFCEVCGYDFTTGQAPAPPAVSTSAVTQHNASDVGWLVVLEVDPEWYSLKGALADQPCPALSSSTVPLTNHTALIGRSSASRGLRPEIALDADTGVSRRHAQFVRDGDSLTVVDLSSTNGTYVVDRSTTPDESTAALVPGVPTELHDGDRVYVGAWSRLTVRTQA